MIFNKSQAILILMLCIRILHLKLIDGCENYKECDELCCDVQDCKETHHNLVKTQNVCTCKNKSEILTTFGGVATCKAILEPKEMVTIFYLSDVECLSNRKCGATCCEDHQTCKENQCVEVTVENLAQVFYFIDKECSWGKPKCNKTCCDEHQKCQDNKCIEVMAEDLAEMYYFSDRQCSSKNPKCNGTCCEDHQQCKENQCVEVTSEDLASIYYLSDKECSSAKAKCNETCCEDHQICKENQCVEVKAADLAKLYHFVDKNYSLETLTCNGTYCLDHQNCKDNQCIEAKDAALENIYALLTLNCNGTQCAGNQEKKVNQYEAKKVISTKEENCKNKCDKFCCKDHKCDEIISNPTSAINNCNCIDTTKVIALIEGVAVCRAKLEPKELIPMFYFNDLCCDTENSNCDLRYCDSQDTEQQEEICSSENLLCNGICCDAEQVCKDDQCVEVIKEDLSVLKCPMHHTACSNICCAPNVPCHSNKCICHRGFSERFNESSNIQYCEPVFGSKTPYIILGIGCILFALAFLIYKINSFHRSM